ncbi:hypothetical protein bpuCAU1_001399 (plasmid) [Borrelia puertoricensis]|uniref:hypothetical protein n=1 Tax=Borrelia puertoricensis TaxID=2756107 RepID=UPI003EB88998
MISKYKTMINSKIKISIRDSWRLNVEFFIRNIWLIMFALFLFFFNVLHSHKGISSYNVGNNSKLYFTLPFTIVIIVVPSSILLYFLYLLRRRVQASVLIFLEKVAIFGLLVIGLVTQSVSSWMSFESFFSLMFEDAILSIKKSQNEKEKDIIRRLSDREKILKDEIANIDVKIKNNNDRIEFAKDKHLSLDYTYRTMKQDYMREIENARKENKALFDQRNEHLKSLDDLGSQFGNLIETTAVNNNRIKAANVLNGTSVVIARDDYLNIIFVYSLLLLSVCLDIFLAMVFCIIQNAYHKFYEQELMFLGSAIECSKSGVNKKIQNRRISSSEKNKKPSKNVDESLVFIASNLEDDKRTIKPMNQINKETNMSDYRIRKYLSDLISRGLVVRDKKRLVLNIDDISN